MQREYKYPIVYVIRKLFRDGKPVAYFTSPAQLFSETKKYKPDGKIEMSYEIDFLDQMQDNINFKVECSPAYVSYYKSEAYSSYRACKIRTDYFNNMLLVRTLHDAEMAGADEEARNAIKKRYETYFKYARGLSEKERNKLESENIKL
ncbi:MAG: hypothetical protein J6Q15_02835 [Clostridia bacterium]|nr:hypothetical protein [Clostridia bacterium]